MCDKTVVLCVIYTAHAIQEKVAPCELRHAKNPECFSRFKPPFILFIVSSAYHVSKREYTKICFPTFKEAFLLPLVLYITSAHLSSVLKVIISKANCTI